MLQLIVCTEFINPVSRQGASGFVFSTVDWDDNVINEFTGIAMTSFDYYPLEQINSLFTYDFDSDAGDDITVQKTVA